MNEGKSEKETSEAVSSNTEESIEEIGESSVEIESPQGEKSTVSAAVVAAIQPCLANSHSNPEILADFIQNLSETLQREPLAGNGRVEKALLRAIDQALKTAAREDETQGIALAKLRSRTSLAITDSVLNLAIKGLENARNKERAQALIQRIQQHMSAHSRNSQNKRQLLHKMDPSSFPGDATTTSSLVGDALSAALADRMAPDASSAAGVVNLLNDVGPACTRNEATFRETLAELSRTSPSGTITDAAMARILYYFSNKSKNAQDAGVGSDGLSSSLLGSILPGRDNTAGDADLGWNLYVVSQVIARDYSATLDWTSVALKWDFFEFNIRDTEQFRTLLQLYHAGSQRYPPLAALTFQWQHAAGQCSLLEAMLSVPPSVYMCELSDTELADAATAPDGPASSSAPNPRCWASSAVLQRLLCLSDIPTLARRVRDLFVKGLLGCPEVLLCALVRLQLNATNAAAQGNANNLANAGLQMKGELMRELIPLFFKPNATYRVQNGPAALRRLWAISPNTVTAACVEAWRSTVSDPPHLRLATIVHIISIVRLLPTPETVIASLLNGSKDPEFSIAAAFVMADREILPLKTWLSERISSNGGGTVFVGALVGYLAKMYTTATPRAPGDASPLVSLENMVVSLQVLHSLDPNMMGQTITTGDSGATILVSDSVKSLTEACATTHPSIRHPLAQSMSAFASRESAAAANGQLGAPGGEDDIDAMANSYYQKIYASEQSIGEVVAMLKRFKTSGDKRENEIFACMIRNLFDEYRFFPKYPEKELRITGILFGTLIKEQLVNSITLGIALRYVLEALRRPPSPPGATTSNSGKMFRFGMFALEQFKERLHEWPQYCSHIVQIPHLKEGYADLVAEIELAMAESQNRANDAASTTSAPSLGGESSRSHGSAPVALSLVAPAPQPSPVEVDKRVPVFGPKLGRAVNDNTDAEVQHEAPPDAVLDRVQFLINNVSPSNVEMKSQELRDMLEPKFFDWLGHYLVVKRISAQPNFHGLYLAFLDHLGDYGKGLVESILSSAYLNIGKLLRSPKITTSTSERSLLKNLGSWLGQITIARNRPILQIMLDCKELLFQGYENGMLIAVTPFVAKILEGAKNSVVFRPPNPWVMGLLGVFRALYQVDDLKMNIKFEVEVLCKNLSIKVEDIRPQSEALAKRIKPVKERNPDFNMKNVASSAPSAPPSGAPTPIGSPEVKGSAGVTPSSSSGDLAGALASTTSKGDEQQDTVIPNLAAYVTINPSLNQLVQAQGGTLATTLTSAAIKRAVPIALDRAIREIIQPVVERSVTIACITTKEIVTKDFATEGEENKVRKAGQLMVANLAGSLALVTCRDPLRTSVSNHLRQLLTNTAGSDKLSEQEQSTIEQCVAICATDNMELGCMLIEKAATEKAVRDVEESLANALTARRKHREQTGGQPYYDMAVLGNGNQRYPGALPEALRPKAGGLRPDQLRVYEAFQRIPRQPAAGGTQSGLAPTRSSGDLQAAGQPLNLELLTTVFSKLDSSVTSLLTSARERAPEITLSMLPPDHDLRKLLDVVQQCVPRNLIQSEKEAVLAFSQNVFKRLYELSLSEPLRLEALVALLEKINESCPQLGKDLGTWATYAPTETEGQRKLHRTVLLLLVRSNLVSTQELDGFLSSSADNGRNPVWVEFSLLFIRTAFLERIAAPGDFPKLMNLMTMIAEGRSQASPQVSQTLRQPILRMLEEVRGTSGGVESRPRTPAASVSGESSKAGGPGAPVGPASSLSSASLSNYSSGTKKVAASLLKFASNDPANSKQQITHLLDNWIRVHSEAASNEKTLAQYLQVLQHVGIGKSDEVTERFFRLATQIVVDAVVKTSTNGSSLNYTVIDIYCKLIPVLFKHMVDRGTPEQQIKQRVSFLNKVLGVATRCIMFDFEKSKSEPGKPFDQRPWFRLMLNITVDLCTPDPINDTMKAQIVGVLGGAFHVLQPLVVPGFSFAWLELVSHRSYLPTLLLLEDQKGWNMAHQLFIDLFLFLEPHLRKMDLTPAVKKLYEGTLRVLLVVLHDFPSFLAAYHLSLCNVIPENCVQLRNIVLSAVPRGVTMPDPFTPNLKIDSLPDMTKSPIILSNVLGPIEAMRPDLDAYLKGELPDFVHKMFPHLRREGSADLDVPRVNALVLYVGMKGINRLQSSQMGLANTPELEILQKLMELNDHGRYLCLNAIANQLRYPSSHTHYFSCVMLFLFSEAKNVAVKEQVTRVLLERLILHRPHPWGLLITFIELIKNQRYQFWSHPFTRCASEIEKVFESVARSCMAPGGQRSAIVGGETAQ